MIKIIKSILILFLVAINANNLVFVHIGPNLPLYFYDALNQAQLFNSNTNFYLIINKSTTIDYSRINKNKLNIVYCEDLKKSNAHILFLENSTLDTNFKEGFWQTTTERFFYLAELIKQENLINVFHIENDNMLYVDLTELLNTLYLYKGIAAVFDCDDRCIPSFMFVPNYYPLKKMVNFLAKNSNLGLLDTFIISQFKNSNANLINNLPIIPKDYGEKYKLCNKLGEVAADQEIYSTLIDNFKSIFDGAAIGQYLGGIDMICIIERDIKSALKSLGLINIKLKKKEKKLKNKYLGSLSVIPTNKNVNFINEKCLFNPSCCTFEWRLDNKNRKVPFIIFNNKDFRINNLHIHTKELYKFKS